MYLLPFQLSLIFILTLSEFEIRNEDSFISRYYGEIENEKDKPSYITGCN